MLFKAPLRANVVVITLLKDEEYVEWVRKTYSNTVRYYRQATSKGLLWELIKMEIRNATISYAKYKAKVSRDRAEDIKRQLEQLDDTICNNFFSFSYFIDLFVYS